MCVFESTTDTCRSRASSHQFNEDMYGICVIYAVYGPSNNNQIHFCPHTSNRIKADLTYIEEIVLIFINCMCAQCTVATANHNDNNNNNNNNRTHRSHFSYIAIVLDDCYDAILNGYHVCETSAAIGSLPIDRQIYIYM